MGFIGGGLILQYQDSSGCCLFFLWGGGLLCFKIIKMVCGVDGCWCCIEANHLIWGQSGISSIYI